MSRLQRNRMLNGMNGIWRFQDLLPTVSAHNQITLGEGNTPLVKSQRIAKELGLSSLYFKLESTNPTGSYKDRIAALGISWALENNRSACIGTSSGNAGASVAAYAARAGIPYHLLVLEQMSEAKMTQIVIYGANVTRINGFGESEQVGNLVFEYIEQQAQKKNWELMITAYKYNPIAMEAVQTISFEVFQNLNNQTPDAVFVPVGGGGLFTGIWKGFSTLNERNLSKKVPQLVAVQPSGCSNIVRAWKEDSSIPLGGDSTSEISGLQVPNPPDGSEVLKVLNEQHGWGEMIDDQSTWKWQEKLAIDEGILCEPAAAISLAGVEKALIEGRITTDSEVVCILTGAGFKDSKRLEAMAKKVPEVELIEIENLQL
ncbi:threonine synthase [Bacillus sp. 1P02SD]|uniref:threonine synthase n=1 Tax=Bacillus sp. 1P02SD TaxID=3132264 RepID=UPI0039A080A4